ncbi:shikimate kinase [Mesonia hippocampi]|uniref:Shikimate kinase n=1 Tax=Mesonia hippocampi TaxID=1628250 RepID=A0A840ERW9_9FLAO|nr:shikimate kinase [Mesonia hippocampi]MBB4119781.1 shikimate kinase [Mesonia hippocampi]
MKTILCGYMGAGKSTLGEQLAKFSGVKFYDLDHEIEKQEGKKISEIFSKKGEIYFRKVENEVLKVFLNRKENYVLALGGGTPCYANNLSLIKENPNTQLIYLKLSIAELTERLFLDSYRRPLIQHLTNRENLEDFIRKHLFERQQYYMQSHKIIAVAQKTIPDLIEEILE